MPAQLSRAKINKYILIYQGQNQITTNGRVYWDYQQTLLSPAKLFWQVLGSHMGQTPETLPSLGHHGLGSQL